MGEWTIFRTHSGVQRMHGLHCHAPFFRHAEHRRQFRQSAEGKDGFQCVAVEAGSGRRRRRRRRRGIISLPPITRRTLFSGYWRAARATGLHAMGRRRSGGRGRGRFSGGDSLGVAVARTLCADGGRGRGARHGDNWEGGRGGKHTERLSQWLSDASGAKRRWAKQWTVRKEIEARREQGMRCRRDAVQHTSPSIQTHC
jgi:hypothetical protein